MARDNHPRARQAQKLARKNKANKSADRILIVTEGEKTEPTYFEDIRKELRLPTTNICAVSSSYGTCPLNIVKYAESTFKSGDKARSINAKEFEKVIVVFDRDEHQKYYQALDLVQQLNKKLRNDQNKMVTFEASVSIPCFELWLLLHYETQYAPIHRSKVYKKLKSHIPNYEKGACDIYQTTKPGLKRAFDAANELSKTNNERSDSQPYTSVNKLVNYLLNMKRK